MAVKINKMHGKLHLGYNEQKQAIACYHVYKFVIWTPILQKEVLMEKEPRNAQSKYQYAVSIIKEGCRTPTLSVYCTNMTPKPQRLNEIRRLYDTGDNSRQYGIHAHLYVYVINTYVRVVDVYVLCFPPQGSVLVVVWREVC